MIARLIAIRQIWLWPHRIQNYLIPDRYLIRLRIVHRTQINREACHSYPKRPKVSHCQQFKSKHRVQQTKSRVVIRVPSPRQRSQWTNTWPSTSIRPCMARRQIKHINLLFPIQKCHMISLSLCRILIPNIMPQRCRWVRTRASRTLQPEKDIVV